MPTSCDPWPGKRKAMAPFALAFAEPVIGCKQAAVGRQFHAATPSPADRLTYVLTVAGAPSPASSFSIWWLIRRSANSAATRIAFLIAFAFDDPCVMKHTPFTPSNGAPPYSV